MKGGNAVNMQIREEALKELESAEGTLTPEQLVQAAADSSHPLHNDGFDWDPESAMHKFNLNNARQLIRSVWVHSVVEEVQVKIPAYLHNPSVGHNEQGYINTVILASDKENAYRAVQRELSYVESYLERAENIAQALGHVPAKINKLRGNVAKLRKEVSKNSPS